jgi:hypothetical protein
LGGVEAVSAYLREVVAYVAEDIRDLITQEDQRHDDRDGNHRDDQCIFDEALAFLFTDELLKIHSPGSPSLTFCPFRIKQILLASVRNRYATLRLP